MAEGKEQVMASTVAEIIVAMLRAPAFSGCTGFPVTR